MTESYGEELAGTAYWETGTGWNITGKRTFAVWAKATADGAWVCICVKSTDNNYYGLVYQGTTGADYNTGNGGVIRVGGTAQDFTNGEWVRVERDLQADLTARFGKTLSSVTGIYLWSGGTSTPRMWIDDLSFSNSLTVEHNTLGLGSIGHILRNRSTNASTYAATDRWFHYDQVGSVMSESDATGALAQTHYQDAFGNSQASWSTGLWGGDKLGWHHNTKELDGDIGLVYMYQRWYNAETGSFGSSSPLSPVVEPPFGFALAEPSRRVDPTGLIDPIGVTGLILGPIFLLGAEIGIMDVNISCVLGYAMDRKNSIYNGIDTSRKNPNFDKEAHCQMTCEASRACGINAGVILNASEIAGMAFNGPTDSFADMAANAAGDEVSGRCGSCSDLCADQDRKGYLPSRFNPFTGTIKK